MHIVLYNCCYVVYGMTETIGGFIGVPTTAGSAAKPGSIGVPIFNSQVKVRMESISTVK